MSLDINDVREQFPSLALTDRGQRRYYFDNPAGTQVPQAVMDAVTACMTNANANIGGYFASSRLAAEVTDAARRRMACFLNAPSTDEVIFGQNMTSLTFHIARSIGRSFVSGDEIILSQMDHDANVEPWRMMARDHNLTIRWMPFDIQSFRFEMSAFKNLLSDRTRLVCVGAASNLTGTINDTEKICALAREAGAWSYVDGVQSAPHILTDVQKTGCDFFVCSAYKFCGPHQGILWGRREALERLQPYKVRPAPDKLPWSFEPGTQSHEAMAGTGAAVEYLAGLGAGYPGDRRARLASAFGRIIDHERHLAARLVEGLQEIPGVQIQGITEPEAMAWRVPTVAFTHSRHSPADIAERLAARNVFVWSGHNYAVEAAKALGIEKSGGAVRIGAVHYNTFAEVDFVLDSLEEILA